MKVQRQRDVSWRETEFSVPAAQLVIAVLAHEPSPGGRPPKPTDSEKRATGKTQGSHNPSTDRAGKKKGNKE